jgi:hypothetical protein
MTDRWASVASWSARRWAAVVGAAVIYALAVGIPTDLVPNPVFGREIAPTWWSWPSLLVTAVLVGLLAATYVTDQPRSEATDPETDERVDTPTRRGAVAGFLTYFAVGCPVCNKLVLLALGSSGALTWFEPAQPLLQVAAVGLLVWALDTRLANQLACAVPASQTAEA